MIYGDAQMLKGAVSLYLDIDGWVSVPDPMRPIYKIGCILENLEKKTPNLFRSDFCSNLVY